MRIYMFAVVLALAPFCATAGVIYSTDGTSSPGFFPANGASSTSTVYHAYQFTVGAGSGGVFDQLAAPILAATSFTATFKLRADSGNNLGSVLDTVNFNLLGDSVGRLYTSSTQNHVTLVAGTKYWLEASVAPGSNSYVWLQADPSVLGRVYSSQTGYFDGQPMLALALLENTVSNSVPEPSSALLLLTGLGVVLYRVRRTS